MLKFNQVIRQKREARGETVAQMARKIHCSAAFARHIESSSIVPVSPRLVKNLARHYRIPISKLESWVRPRNKIGRRYYREHRRKTAA